MMQFEDLIQKLDDSQREAARIGANAVIAAGAGSGKTRVLAARFVHLIVEKGIPVGEILALTFTTKAAAEMYSRIYETLRDIDHPAAREAVRDFHLARIDTIDSFCNSVARNACRKYGFAPDFAIDPAQARKTAETLALPFFLERRASPAIRQFMKRYSLAELSTALFADTVLKYSCVSAPLDFARFRVIQEAEIASRFPRVAEDLYREISKLGEIAGATGSAAERIRELLPKLPPLPEASDRESITAFIDFCASLTSVSFRGRITNPALLEMKEILGAVKETLYPDFLDLCNYILNREFVDDTFNLLADFQQVYHRKQREVGIMTFADVSRMAVDALTFDPDLRASYKAGISAIMIDEFQDDNELQRNLLFLVAEKPGRRDLTIPKPEELSPDKLFFVGDEKQSIYRFRGADVSVFRALSRDLGCADMPKLDTNYRTETGLIEAFNRVFPEVFLNPGRCGPDGIPLFEASFEPIRAARKTEGITPSLNVLLVRKKERNGESAAPDLLPPNDTEAAEVSRRIRALLDEGAPVLDGDTPRPCRPDDFAILFRSSARQSLFEKYLREEGLSCQAESMRGLFADAPVNDLHALLRLAVYPSDNAAYAAVLRSPFVTIGDEGFAAAILARTAAERKGLPTGEPFSETVDEALGDHDRERFAAGRRLYRSVRDLADRIPAAELVTRLWYTEGYRYATLSDPGLHRYLELYDYYFELARQADAAGDTLVAFVDRVSLLISSGDKIDDLDIPVEHTGGVRLMTIHKSKGLEFPFVFLIDCGNPGQNSRNSAPVYFSPDTGISVNTGAADDAASAKSNYFYRKGYEEEKKKEFAELRRLLYVAMTRAENRLFISGCVSLGKEPPEEARSGETLREAIAEWAENRTVAEDGSGGRTFFDLVLPAFGTGEIPSATVTEILPLPRSRNHTSRLAAIPAHDAEKAYATAPVACYPAPERTRLPATALKNLHAGSVSDEFRPTHEETAPEPDELDRLLQKAGLSASDFGTIAHRAIEAEFTGLPLIVPDDIRAAANQMKDRFFASSLGVRARAASWRRYEYGFLTRYEAAGRTLSVSGQMDLVFEEADRVVVVDYKTDRREIAEEHAEQLAVYRKAARDLRVKPAETWLFYLRSGRQVLVE